MHSKNEERRIACKNFFVKRLSETIHMSLENVGECDDVVWHFDRKKQDAYYPFMDRLHMVMNIKRIPYDDLVLRMKQNLPLSLTTKQKLTMAMASKSVLYTLDRKILAINVKNIKSPEIATTELKFPLDLDYWYHKSLVLRV